MPNVVYMALALTSLSWVTAEYLLLSNTFLRLFAHCRDRKTILSNIVLDTKHFLEQ